MKVLDISVQLVNILLNLDNTGKKKVANLSDLRFYSRVGIKRLMSYFYLYNNSARYLLTQHLSEPPFYD